jgi:hypothetical protein
VTVTAAEVATLSTTLQLVSNDADENPFDIPLTAQVTAVPQYQFVGNDDAEHFTSTVGFYHWPNSGRGGTLRYASNGNGSEFARWTSGQLPAGTYRVWTTWVVDGSSRPSDAPYTIFDGSTELETVRLNQQVASNEATIDGTGWKSLGTFTISNGKIVVELHNDADSHWVVADDICIEWMGGS